jgi:hypothetical protein
VHIDDAEAYLTVKADFSIEITPISWTPSSSGSMQLIATAKYGNGSTKDITGEATWSTSKPSVATVTSSGVVTTSGKKGSTTIKASWGGKKGVCKVNVKF